jgi:hypothetical protein
LLRIKLLATAVTQSKSHLFGISESYGQEEFRFRTLHYWYLPYYHIKCRNQRKRRESADEPYHNLQGLQLATNISIKTIATWTERIHCNIFLTV